MKNPSDPDLVTLNPSESFEDRIAILFEEVQLAIRWDRPSILLAVYASEVIHNQAQEEFEKQVQSLGQKITRIKVDKEHFDIPWFLSQFEHHEKVVFSVSGLRWGGGRSRSNAYQALNIRRELFVDQKIRLVVWLNEKEAADLPYHAPDFWAFRHRVVEFPENLSSLPSVAARDDLSWRDWHVNESPTDLDAKIRLRESLLAELPVNPGSLSTRTDLIYTLAFLYWAKPDYENASTYIEKGLVLTAHPQAAAAQTRFRLALGVLYHDKYLLDKAVTVFQQVIEREPRNPEAWNNLGRVFHDQHRLPEAIQAYQRALKLAPRSGNAWNNLGNCFRENDQPKDALQSFKKATRFEPQNPKPWINLAHACLASGQPDQAIRAYKNATRLAPGDADLLNDLGNIYREMNRLKDAVASFNKAIKISPDFAPPHAGLAACYRSMGKVEAAQKQIELGRSLLEGQTEFKRAEFESLCGNTGEALRLLKIALDRKQLTLQALHSNPIFNPLHPNPNFQKLGGS
jgi:tetratricopeptide (TPR) repeat protein